MSNCTHIESLLPAFVENQLTDAERARVRSHVETCAACRASLVAFEALEASLVMRRAELPPVDAYLPSFAPAAAPLVHHRLLRFFRALTSVPGVSIMLAMWAAMLAFNFRVPISRALSFSTPAHLTGDVDRFADLLVLLTGGNTWLLVGIATLVGIGIAASTGALTLRFVRR